MNQKISMPTHTSASRSHQPSGTGNASSSNVTLEQQRAAYALKQIDGVKNEIIAGDYKSYVESLSATIVMNGLGQAAATLLAQSKGDGGTKDAHRRLFDHIEEWLCDAKLGIGLRKPLMNSLVECDQMTYCHAQAEALAYLVWLKKFAQAFLSRDNKPSKGTRDGQ